MIEMQPSLEAVVIMAGMEWRNRPVCMTARYLARLQFQLMTEVMQAAERDFWYITGHVAWRLILMAAGEEEA